MHHTIIISLVLKLNPIVMPGNFSCLMIILQGHLNLFNSHVLSSHKIYFYEKIFFFFYQTMNNIIILDFFFKNNQISRNSKTCLM